MWAARIDTMPAIRVLPPPVRDWDAVIGDGEATLSTVSERYRRYVARPLATAYHQRACRSLAAGALEAARVDLERAVEIDPYVEHHTTLAVVLERMGRREAARAVLAKGIVGARAWGPVYEDEIIVAAGDHGPPEDLARALEITGLFALHDGDPAAAESALREAWTLAPSASRAHALGAALYHRGDVAGAAELEWEAVARAPDHIRYRWDLAVSLARLGRAAEAKLHAEAALRHAPDDSPLRERFTRLFRADMTEPGRE
jgi:tetratricopeptide (TPR) repeat protein